MISKKRMKEFLDKLEGEGGCNFRRVGGKTTWNCNAMTGRPLAHKVLRSMRVSAAGIKEIMDAAQKYGGYCDCEILLNAKPGLMRKAKKDV